MFEDKLKKIKLVITDVDGVLTDGGLFYNEDGECFKKFNVRDGLGIKMLQKNNIEVAVVSGGDSKPLRQRTKALGIKEAHFAIPNKKITCEDIINRLGVSKEETVFIGDDVIDFPAFEACGLAVTVADAFDYIKEKADWVLKSKGGTGAFREVSDNILKAKGLDYLSYK